MVSHRIYTILRTQSILFEPYLYFNDTRAMRRSVLHGLGIAQFHDYIIAEDLKEIRLVEILPKYTEQKKTIPIHISYFPASHVHIKVRCFLDFMVEIANRKLQLGNSILTVESNQASWTFYN